MKSRKKGAKKKGSIVSGDIKIQFSIADPSNPTTNPHDILQRFMALAAVSTAEDGEDDEPLTRFGSQDADEDDTDESKLGSSDETDDPTKPEAAAKRKKRLRLKKLRRKTKARAYEFTGGSASDVVGIVFLEIGKITDLPPERNSRLFRLYSLRCKGANLSK